MLHCCTNLEQDFKVSHLNLFEKHQRFVIIKKGEIVESLSVMIKLLNEDFDDNKWLMQAQQIDLMKCLFGTTS